MYLFHSTVFLFGAISYGVTWLPRDVSAAFLTVKPKVSTYQDIKRFHVNAVDVDQDGEWLSPQRRSLFKAVTLFTAQIASLDRKVIGSAEARGLMKFPCKDYQFLNTYHFMRAGESFLEEEGVWVTNPLFLTNRESALSAKGIEQIDASCKRLKEEGIAPTIVRYSLAASAMDTTDIVGKELKIGRNYLVPEFNFMDPRAIGKWDMLPLDSTQSAVWAMDAKEAGNDGTGGLPPANEDSTPNETLADQVVRLRQLISVLETQYSGDTILLVFPDGTGPALLTCLIGGIPLKRVHEFEYRSGEVRLNVDYESAHKYFFATPSEEYLNVLQNGETQLETLRTNPEQILNVRDQQYQKEVQIENERIERQERAKKEKDLHERTERQERAKIEKDLLDLQGRAEVSNQQKSLDSNFLSVAGLTTAGAIGAFTFFGTDPEESKIDDKSTNDSYEENPLIASNDEVKNVVLLDIKKPVSIPMPPIQETSAESTSSISTDGSNAGRRQDQYNSWDLDVDDGGEAWLGSLSDIMNEEEGK